LFRIVQDVLIGTLRLPLERDQIQPDTPLFGTGIGLDSIDAVDLAVGVEERSGVRLPDGPRTRAGLRTVNQLIDLVLSLEGSDVGH
jgi:acyl carrier protein